MQENELVASSGYHQLFDTESVWPLWTVVQDLDEDKFLLWILSWHVWGASHVGGKMFVSSKKFV